MTETSEKYKVGIVFAIVNVILAAMLSRAADGHPFGVIAYVVISVVMLIVLVQAIFGGGSANDYEY